MYLIGENKMWVFTRFGFISIVQHNADPSIMLVRSRTIEPLDALWPGSEVIVMSRADYRYRIFVPREVVSEVIMGLLDGLDYPNFKSTCTDDDDYQLALASVWRTMYGYQERAGDCR